MSQIENQQSELKTLIAMGKEQGYLTFAEINDYLPPDVLDAEQVEDIISILNDDMGIKVYETPPDEDTLLLDEDSTADEETAEAAAVALILANNEFGRTTDPVRMYMREMGTVELLTRQGEIEIAKRIEDGLNQVKYSMAHFPPTMEKLLEVYEAVSAGDTRMQDFVVGFIDPNAPDEIKSPVTKSDNDDKSDDDEVIDTGPDPAEVTSRLKAIRRKYKKTLTLSAMPAFAIRR